VCYYKPGDISLSHFSGVIPTVVGFVDNKSDTIQLSFEV